MNVKNKKVEEPRSPKTLTEDVHDARTEALREADRLFSLGAPALKDKMRTSKN